MSNPATVEQLNAFAKRLQECLQQSLQQSTEIDHIQFAALVNEALTEGILTVDDIADKIDVSLPIVRDWAMPRAEGKPYPRMRRHAIKAMRALVLSKIRFENSCKHMQSACKSVLSRGLT
jgi:hypothetical protein